MILVDKQILKLVKDKKLINNFVKDRLGSISYDVVIDKFIIMDMEVCCDEYILLPNEYVYIKTYESLNMMDNLCCYVAEKNSLMRKGLKVSGPLYQPGHKTNVFLRVQNLTKNNVILNKGMEISQLVFVKLDDIPNRTYNMQDNAKYNDEFEFRG